MSRHADTEEQGVVQGALHGAQSLAQSFGLLLIPALYSWQQPSSHEATPVANTVQNANEEAEATKGGGGALAFVVGGGLNFVALCVASRLHRRAYCMTELHVRC